MPNSGTEPQGKVTASATPCSRMSRTSGALDCTLVPPSEVTKLAMVACAGRIFLALEWNEPGSCMKARQNLTSFISASAYLRYQESKACEPPLALATRNGN